MAQLLVPASALPVTCPGATAFDGPVGDVVVVCGPLKRDRDLDAGIDRGDPMSVTFSTREDGLQVNGFCCGDYRECMIWRSEQARLDANVPRFRDLPQHQRVDRAPLMDGVTYRPLEDDEA